MEDEANLRQRAAEGMVFSVLEQLAQRGVSILVLLLLARLLQPRDFGVVALAIGITTFIGVLLERGFPQAIIQRHQLSDSHLHTAFWGTMILGILFFLVGIGMSGWLGRVMGEPLFGSIFRWLSLSFLIEAASGVPRALLQRQMRFRPLAVHALIAASVSGIVGVTMAIYGMGVWSLVGQLLVDRIARLLMLYVTTLWHPKLFFSGEHFLQLWSYAVHVVGNKVVEFLGKSAAEFFIGFVLGFTALGYYVLASKVVLTLTGMLTIGMHRVGVSAFSRVQKEKERVCRLLYGAIRLGSFFSFPLFTLLILLAPQIIVVAFGEQWASAVPTVRVLAFMGLFMSVFFWNNIVIVSIGKPAYLFKISVVTTSMTLLGLMLVVMEGIVVVAVVQALRVILVSIMTTATLQMILGFRLKRYLFQLVVPLAATLLMATVVLFLKDVFIVGLGELVGTGTLVVCGAAAYLIAVCCLSQELLREVRSLLYAGLQGMWKWQ